MTKIEKVSIEGLEAVKIDGKWYTSVEDVADAVKKSKKPKKLIQQLVEAIAEHDREPIDPNTLSDFDKKLIRALQYNPKK